MRLLIRQDSALPGQYLMDRDLRELEQAAAGEMQDVVLSFYQWEVPTLSLGFHQSDEKIDFEQLDAHHVPLVRRPTGGAAVLHSEELTYSIVLPGMDDLRTGALVLEYVGRALTTGLCAVGVDAKLDERGESLSPLANRTSCFARTSRWEVGVHGKKIVGSAQRRLGNAILQHGSILTGPDHLRIAELLKVKDPAERALLRARLSSKATSVSDELGDGDHISKLRKAMEVEFSALYPSFLERVCELTEIEAH